MAAGAFTFYDSTAKIFMGGADLTTTTVKLGVVAATYTPNSDTDDAWGDVSANQISSTNTGYTADGHTLTTPVLTEITKGFKFSSDSVVITAGSSNLPTHKYYVMYVSATVEGVVNPLIGYFEGVSGSTVPETTSGNTLTIAPSDDGWFDMTRP
jgi:hypothetical protein